MTARDASFPVLSGLRIFTKCRSEMSRNPARTLLSVNTPYFCWFLQLAVSQRNVMLWHRVLVRFRAFLLEIKALLSRDKAFIDARCGLY